MRDACVFDMFEFLDYTGIEGIVVVAGPSRPLPGVAVFLAGPKPKKDNGEVAGDPSQMSDKRLLCGERWGDAGGQLPREAGPYSLRPASTGHSRAG
jgi:hypothetical protein